MDEIWTAQRSRSNFFGVAAQLTADPNPTLPLQTFIGGSTAIHLNLSPSLHCVPVDRVTQIFDLPDLRGALGDYVNCEDPSVQNFHSFRGQRRCPPDVYLLFKELHVWFRVRLQQMSYHEPCSVSSTFSVHAHPPNSDKWKYGRYDAAILNVDQEEEWPSSGL